MHLVGSWRPVAVMRWVWLVWVWMWFVVTVSLLILCRRVVTAVSTTSIRWLVRTRLMVLWWLVVPINLNLLYLLLLMGWLSIGWLLVWWFFIWWLLMWWLLKGWLLVWWFLEWWLMVWRLLIGWLLEWRLVVNRFRVFISNGDCCKEQCK